MHHKELLYKEDRLEARNLDCKCSFPCTTAFPLWTSRFLFLKDDFSLTLIQGILLSCTKSDANFIFTTPTKLFQGMDFERRVPSGDKETYHKQSKKKKLLEKGSTEQNLANVRR